MSALRLTREQQACVEHRGSTLLVSAAAGSGKTKVLVERLLSQVCDLNDPKNVDDFLIITYTKKAAAELRVKIMGSITERLSETPDDTHLRRQLSRMALAHISTVHAFCADTLRRHAQEAGLVPDFGIAENAQCRILAEQAMQSVLERAAEESENESDTESFFRTMANGYNDKRTAELVRKLYDASRCRIEPEQWLKNLAGAEGYTLSGSEEERILLDACHVQAEGVLLQIRRAEELLAEDKQLTDCFAPIIDSERSLFQSLLAADQWNQVKDILDLPNAFHLLPRKKKGQDEALRDAFKKLREEWKDTFKDLQKLFDESGHEAECSGAGVIPAVRGLANLTLSYSEAFTAAKRRRHLLDFGDLEHEMLKLVRSKAGRPTKAAKEIASEICEIMVDEYQDTNAVQDAIFQAVSKDGKNLFLVGDVKQSIYRFRMADPTIFLRRYNSFEDDPQEGMPRRISLSCNFRSRPEILSACNDVFHTVMSPEVGGLRYTEREALHAGRTDFPDLADQAVELSVLKSSTDSDSAAEKRDQHAEWTAERISELLRCGPCITGETGLRPAGPSDIVILLRSMKNRVEPYLKALRSRGIPCCCDLETNILETTECSVLLDVLRIINNPLQDIPLASVLLSPLIGLTAEEISSLRLEDSGKTLYDSLRKSSSTKIADFVQKLHGWRLLIQQMYTDELAETVFAELRAEQIFGSMKDGTQRVRNISAFRNYLHAHAKSGAGGLMELLNDIDIMQENGEGIDAPTGESAADCVRLMSMHKSKGLEFPVVFLPELDYMFNRKDQNEIMLIDPELGVGCNTLDTELRFRYPTPLKNAIRIRMKQAAVSEELRILYVAMTRASDRLIMSCMFPDPEKKIRSIAVQATDPAAVPFTSTVSCYADWILMAAVQRTEAGALRAMCEILPESRVSDYPWKITFQEQALIPDSQEQKTQDFGDTPLIRVPDQDELRKRIAFSYRYTASETIPAKLTATQMKGRDLDAEAEEDSARPDLIVHFDRPFFLEGEKPLSAAQKGNAVHLFMQYADYSRCTDHDGIRSELSRLREKGFLTQQQTDAVKEEEILHFFSTELGKKISSGTDVVREFKFSVLADAAQFYPDAAPDEKIILQGVIDSFFIEPDGITVIDFKTDHVTADNIRERTEYYRGQVSTYRIALESIFEMPVRKTVLYFFSGGIAVSV